MVLIVGALLLGGRHGKTGGNQASATLAALESNLLLIEGRVENLRGLDFNRRPLPVLVAPSAVKKEGLAELDQEVTPAQEAADDELLKLLGLIPASSNLRSIQADVFQEQVAGFYDPQTGRLALVKNAGASDESVAEITLAHELTHALDDQRFGLKDVPPGTDDAATAYNSLVEGDATSVMTRYATRYLTGSNLLGALFTSSTSGTAQLPPYILASLEFPYLEGQRFVDTLYRVGAHSWKLVNGAFKFRPPISTQQILNPLDYIHNVKPLPVRLRVKPLLGKGWRPIAASSMGEFDTRQLLQLGIGSARAPDVAGAWRGGRYQLWRRGAMPANGCAAPCRARDSLVIAWRTTPGAATQAFETGLGAYVTKGLEGRARGHNLWTIPGGAASVSTVGDNTVLALAPDVVLASVLSDHAVAPTLGR
ncbi:MAG TPA: hypothetical protein VGF74_07970 [Thermoleophilaceae bacterium]